MPWLWAILPTMGMLKVAGLSACMANGTPDAKAAADRIIGDVREDGVAALIEELWFDGPRAEPSGKDFGPHGAILKVQAAAYELCTGVR